MSASAHPAMINETVKYSRYLRDVVLVDQVRMTKLDCGGLNEKFRRRGDNMTVQACTINSTQPVTELAVTGKDLRRVIGASTAGSAMEWYDFSIYGTAS